MFAEIWQEITELTKDQKFVRNLGLVTIITLTSSFSIAAESTNPNRLVQQEKLEQFSNLMSVGFCIRNQSIFSK